MTHLLRVEQEPGVFAPLLQAARSRGLRIGWLELTPGSTPGPVPARLEAAATGGVLRAVAVGSGRSVTVKPMTGEPVLKDLLREHFSGCRAVLVRGDVAAPLLLARGAEWELTGAAGKTVRWDTRELLDALRRPRLPVA